MSVDRDEAHTNVALCPCRFLLKTQLRSYKTNRMRFVCCHRCQSRLRMLFYFSTFAIYLAVEWLRQLTCLKRLSVVCVIVFVSV